jgi:hypothetical protein
MNIKNVPPAVALTDLDELEVQFRVTYQRFDELSADRTGSERYKFDSEKARRYVRVE